MIIINAENMLLGRITGFAAKKILLGEQVAVINCEKAMVSGRKYVVLEKYRQKLQRGSVRKGPFISKSPQMLVKRTIRGMVPFKMPRGKMAMKRLKCYPGLPDEFKGKEFVSFEKMNVSNLPSMNYVSIGTISKELGGIK
ncbi:50S ribosomal protein L13 [Candidatus Woesearchaeota archaeon]|nr:50S ribosomal protein L13 [Candidatus Woesearchaeota archaeon]